MDTNKHNKRFVVGALAASLGVLLFVAASQSRPDGENGCPNGSNWETGVVNPKNPTRKAGSLLLMSLSMAVDPAKPDPRHFIIVNDAAAGIGNTWIDVTTFKGPLFLSKGAELSARADWSGDIGAVYSGCRF